MSLILDGTAGATSPAGIAVGNATVQTGGIAFPATQVAVTDVNTLDDYEEGTWTPSQGAGLTVVGAFSSTGVYTKIGRLVTAIGSVTGATSVAVTAGTVVAGNLPFTCGSTLAMGSGMNGTATVSISCYVNAASTSVSAASALTASSTIYFEVTYFV